MDDMIGVKKCFMYSNKNIQGKKIHRNCEIAYNGHEMYKTN